MPVISLSVRLSAMAHFHSWEARLQASFSVARATGALLGNLGCPTLRDSQGHRSPAGVGCSLIPRPGHCARRRDKADQRSDFVSASLLAEPALTLRSPWGPRRPRRHLAGGGNSELD